ncbi:MAG: hypothetical protein K8R74_01860, partial [Bacteroidales bacterium]|nr:hypothetical protein [Bacteroidales bacterium]
MNGIMSYNTPLHPSQEGNVGIHFSEFFQQVRKLINRHCEPKGWIKGWSEAICLFTHVGLLIIRLLHSFALPCAKVRNDVPNLFFSLKGLIIILLATTVTTQATIITVKQDGTGNYTSIQQAYENANNGDTILVYPGVYYENIDIHFTMVDITIASLYLTTQDESYIYNTIIDGNQQGSCLAAHSCGISVVTITGLTLRNGMGQEEYDYDGGGVYTYYCMGGLYLNNCIIENNTARSGGGILAYQTDIYLSETTIRYNHAYKNGGAIYCNLESNTIFDAENKCNIYLNYAAKGADYSKSFNAGPQTIIVDTFTVLEPDYHFYYSWDVYNYPNDDLTWSIDHGKLEPVAHDLFIDPVTGDNNNSGLSFNEPLKTIAYAYKKIKSDSINKYSIYLTNGTYSPSTNGEKLPLNARTYVSLIGENMNSTIIDAEMNTFLFEGYGLAEDYNLENITFQNGNGLTPWLISHGGLKIEWNINIRLENIIVRNCFCDYSPGISIGRGKNTSCSNV